jgi:hypothetical protein
MPAKVANNGDLFVYSPQRQILIAFLPDGRVFGSYDLSSLLDWRRTAVYDFQPFDADYVLFLLSGGSTTSTLYKYDLGSQTFTPFHTQPPKSYITCSSSVAKIKPGLSRLGNSSALLCSLENISPTTANWTFGINIVDMTIGSVSSIAEVESNLQSRPWEDLLAGQDGQIYIQPTYYSFSGQFVHPTDGFYIIERYNPRNATWSVIKIPLSSIPELGDLQAIDASGNMFFSLFPRNGGPQQIIKVASDGTVIWNLSENELGTSGRVIGVTNDGDPLLWNITGSSYTVQRCSTSHTPSHRIGH